MTIARTTGRQTPHDRMPVANGADPDDMQARRTLTSPDWKVEPPPDVVDPIRALHDEAIARRRVALGQRPATPQQLEALRRHWTAFRSIG